MPGQAPSGEYLYVGYVGLYPDEILNSDSFTLEKLTTESGLSNSTWDAESAVEIQSDYALMNLYPNPFNPSTVLSFELRAASFVKLAVYDIQGREVARLADGWHPAGIYERTWNASEMSSGVYFARLNANGVSQVRKLLLVK